MFGHDVICSKQLWITRDYGQTFIVVQEYVKAFFWSNSDTDGQPRLLCVEREEPSGMSTVLASPTMFEGRNYTVLIRGVEDFQVRDEFMFATKKVDAVSICAVCDTFLKFRFIFMMYMVFCYYISAFQFESLKSLHM
jgi:hypothetical protein